MSNSCNRLPESANPVHKTSLNDSFKNQTDSVQVQITSIILMDFNSFLEGKIISIAQKVLKRSELPFVVRLHD